RWLGLEPSPTSGAAAGAMGAGQLRGLLAAAGTARAQCSVSSETSEGLFSARGIIEIFVDATRGPGRAVRKGGVELETRRAIGAQDGGARSHVEVDVRMIGRRGHADAVERPDA